MRLTMYRGSSAAIRVVLIAIGWLGFISCLHLHLNAEHVSVKRVVMGYMPVITNLAAPLVDAASKQGSEVKFEALKFASFAEMGEAFRAGYIQVAFIIAPLAIVLYQQGVPLKVVYIGNRHESTLVMKRGSGCRSADDLQGKTIAVPIRYSGHMLALRRLLRERGIGPEAIHIFEIPPPDMPAALASGGIDGYFVGEPFAGKSLREGIAERFLDVESIWPRFICNLMIVRDDLIRKYPERVKRLVAACARSGMWAGSHIPEAITIASRYWGQDPEVVEYAFSHPSGRVRFDLYVPIQEEMDEIAAEMRKAGLLEGKVDVSGIVDDRYAKAVSVEPIDSFERIMDE